MAQLKITIVGQDLAKIVIEKMELVGINAVNHINTGMLGNLKTLTYIADLEESEIIEKRKKLMNAMAEDCMRLMPLYAHGDWMRIFVFKPIKT